MVLFIVIAILIISWGIEQVRAGQWKSDRLKKKPNYTNTYLDYFGMERDRVTDQPRFIGTDISGDRIMYDKKHNIISNLSKENENDKFMALLPQAKEKHIQAIELDMLPSEKNKTSGLFSVRKKYKDVVTGANYIVIKGNQKRGMDLANYYYDYETSKVVGPSDGFVNRFHNPNMCRVRNTTSMNAGDLTWDDVLNEVPKLQKDIDKNGLDWMSVCATDLFHG